MLLRTTLLAAAQSDGCRALVEGSRLTRQLVTRFIAGRDITDAIRVASDLTSDREVTLDHLGESTTDATKTAATVRAYERLLQLLDDAGLTPRVEVSIKLSAIGGSIAPAGSAEGTKIALANAQRICAAAAAVGTTVTVDMEDHSTTDQTLEIVRDLRADFPSVGVVLQAYLRRTEQDCRELATPESRVRLCKGAYQEPSSVAYRRKSEVDLAYVRCLRILMHGKGYPMIATHDSRLIAVADDLAARAGRAVSSFEYQMLYGIRPKEQHRIAARGRRLRVYVPYGEQWYAYFMRRLAERPANLAFFLRSLATKN